MNLFADSSALIALGNPEDRHYAAALRVFQGLGVSEVLHISNYVVTELLTRLSRRLGSRHAATHAEQLQVSRLFDIHWIGEDLHREALALFRSTDDKHLSFTDCTSFVLMRRLGLRTAFTFDRDFAAAGFEVVPRA